MRVFWVAVVAGCGFETPAPLGTKAGVDQGAGFDAATCPASYRAALPGPSRYRLITAGAPAWVQSDLCNLDLPGATHLVVLETMPEVVAVSGLVDATGGIARNAVWIGGVQEIRALTPRDNWLGFDGQPLIDAWHTGEPNDGSIEDHREQFVQIQLGRRYFTDSAGTDSNGALCECDGKSLPSNVIDAITSNRP